jgi:hypothetical protein
MPTERVTFWETREALEINFDPAAVQKRQSLEQPAAIFKDKNSAEQYAFSERPEQVLASARMAAVEDFSQPTQTAEKLRYPILRKYDLHNLKFEATDDIYEVGFINIPVNRTKFLQGGLAKEQAVLLPQESPGAIYERAYANMNCKNLPQPLFKIVVLMTGVDLAAWINLLGELVEAANTGRLSESWRNILYEAGGDARAYQSVQHYAELKLGLPVNSDLLKVSLRTISIKKRIISKKFFMRILRARNGGF